MRIKSLKKIKEIRGKRIFLRADLNVPMKSGKIRDDFKIKATLPTIRYLLRYDCRIVIATHLGKPKGKKEAELSTKPIAERLAKLLDMDIKFSENCIGLKVGTEAGRLKEKEILFLENLRFYKEEEENNLKFARELAALAEIYVNDSFSVDHRGHASLDAIKKYLPSYAGLLLEKEILNLEKIKNPKKPLIVIMGGAKINTKIPLIKNILPKAEKILIGGVIAVNFLSAKNFEIGKSKIDNDGIKIAKSLKSDKILLPIDVLVKNKDVISSKSVNKVLKSDTILDIGPGTIKLYSRYIKKAQTIVWNGPMGKFEEKPFKLGTLSIARLVASRSSGRAFGVAGGGETIEALAMTGMSEYVDWVSTGGGAMLAYLGEKKMPGLKKIVYN